MSGAASELLARWADGRASHRTPLRRADAVLGGAVWWACHLAVMYWLVPRVCVAAVRWPLQVATVVLLALCGRALLSAVQLLRAGRAAEHHLTVGAGRTSAADVDPTLGDGDDVEADEHARRDVYLGWLGVLLSVFFTVVVVAQWIPATVLDPCA